MAETKADNPSSSTYLHPTPEKKKREKTKTIGHLRQPVNKFKRKSPYHKVTQEKSPPPPLISGYTIWKCSYWISLATFIMLTPALLMVLLYIIL